MKVFIASDHAGLKLKEKIKSMLKCEVVDCGPFTEDKNDDYPDFIKKVGEFVSKNKGKGIVIGGTGIGECIVVNKFKNVRGALVFNEYTAIKSREHNDSNVICLGARITPIKKALKLVKIWLETAFKNGRHARRIKKIKEIEAKNFK
jgi:ribose 5-phosphate isomerase B